MPRTKKGSTPSQSSLRELAAVYGIEVAYQNVFGKQQDASPETLLRVLQILGAPVQKESDAPAALRERRHELAERGLEPVALAWDGRADGLILRLPQRSTARKWQCRLKLEDGEERRWEVEHEQLSMTESVPIEGENYVARKLSLPETLPRGYHHLEIEAGEKSFTTLLISAPLRAYSPTNAPTKRTWGVFLPLYALHSARSWGSGDFTDLRNLLSWVHKQGGGVAATLPLLAAFLDEPFECSPYSPVSRLFWNEFYMDVESIPELSRCQPARDFLNSAEFAREGTALRESRQVDYRRQMALKRRVLMELARLFFRESSPRRAAFEQYVKEHPRVEDYACFRAVGERSRTPWTAWPTRLRDGTIRAGDYDEDIRNYHRYVQWIAEEQLSGLSAEARRSGPGLYLDLPLGVHGHGYDVWRERDAFATDASGGAAPDAVFTRGQDWGFPPMHPEQIRRQGYRYVLAYLRRQLAYAGVLRIDHMPVFHRLYWIPRGMPATQGVYVRYPAEELYAVFSLESHRHKAMLVGEDLGTVPPEVPESMNRHNVQRMYVVQYCLQDDPKKALPAVPAGSVASVNTHDMPPFLAYGQGDDIAQREQLGLLGQQDPEEEKEHRRSMIESLAQFLRSRGLLSEATDPLSLLRACLRYLAASEAGIVLVNLEDSWQERQPQNLPGTSGDCPNWRNRARYSLEEFSQLAEVIQTLQEVNAARQGT